MSFHCLVSQCVCTRPQVAQKECPIGGLLLKQLQCQIIYAPRMDVLNRTYVARSMLLERMLYIDVNVESERNIFP